jgi:hypothetical protein
MRHCARCALSRENANWGPQVFVTCVVGVGDTPRYFGQNRRTLENGMVIQPYLILLYTYLYGAEKA